MQPFMLEGKTILITGASSGIGRGIAVACAKAGAKCILVARDVTRLNETLSLCEGVGHTIEALDVTDYEALTALVDRVPVLDGLVQCAGMSDNHTPLKFLKPEFIDKLFAVNVKAPILLLATLEKKKKLAKGGSVILMGSISSFYAAPAHSLYGATKGALLSFMKGAAKDLSGKLIRVNAIAPAWVNTPLINFSSLTEEQRKASETRYPLKRCGEPEDVAGMALYLLSDASTWVTGQQFVLDGGFTIGG